jgi:hypothetical protein
MLIQLIDAQNHEPIRFRSYRDYNRKHVELLQQTDIPPSFSNSVLFKLACAVSWDEQLEFLSSEMSDVRMLLSNSQVVL